MRAAASAASVPACPAPITITSKRSGYSIRTHSIRQNLWDEMISCFSLHGGDLLSSWFESAVRADEVSRETLPSAPRMRPNEPYTCFASNTESGVYRIRRSPNGRIELLADSGAGRETSSPKGCAIDDFRLPIGFRLLAKRSRITSPGAIIVKHMCHVRCREMFRGLLAEAKTGENLSQQIVRRHLPSQLR